MQPGIELDQIIAAKVMGWSVLGTVSNEQFKILHAQGIPPGGKPGWNEIVPSYSTKIEDAWAVLEKLAADGYGYAIQREYNPMRGEWIEAVRIFKAFEKEVQCAGNTIPHSICLAALKALGVS